MKLSIFYVLVLVPLLGFAQIPEQDTTPKPTYTLLMASTEMQNDFARQQKDILYHHEERFQEMGLDAFHLTPTQVTSVYKVAPRSQTINFNRYAEILDKEATFKVIIVDHHKVVKYTKDQPITFEEITTLLENDQQRLRMRRSVRNDSTAQETD